MVKWSKTNAFKINLVDVLDTTAVDGDVLVYRNSNTRYELEQKGDLTNIDTAIATITGDTTLDASYHTILADTTSNSITITLPSATTTTGRQYHIKKIASQNTLTIATSETIDGASEINITLNYESYKLISDGNAWYII